jgi:Rrf2 family protein
VKLNKESEHAIKGLAYLARQPQGKPTTLEEIAASQRLPKSFLSKIFRRLSAHGIVGASRGVDGGYFIQRPPEGISLLDIIEAVEGPKILGMCLFWDKGCDEDACPLCQCHVMNLRDTALGMLRSTTLASLAQGPGGSAGGGTTA